MSFSDRTTVYYKADNIALMNTTKINTPQISSSVDVPTTQNMTISDIIKVGVFITLSLLGVIGAICACMTSHIVSPFVPVPPQNSVDGEWSEWTRWSQCSITCSSASVPLGNMTRTRYCNSPPPQLGGKSCNGNATEITDCFRKPCPIPVDGQWAEWSAWSACSGSCQSGGNIPRQQRRSSCTNPAPQDGGKLCEGDSTQERFCHWLTQCPVDGQWGDWHVAGACESVNRRSCALGKKLYQRQCNNPLPSGSGRECQGLREKNEDCWFDIGCPVGLQPPLSLQVLGNGSGVFEVRWMSVPYGGVAAKYRMYLTVEDVNRTQIETVLLEVSVSPSKEVAGTKYTHSVDLRRFLKSGDFVSVGVRMSAIDYWGSESHLGGVVRSGARAVDGQWGGWDHWSDCSTRCINKRGTRVRKRKCDSPSPAQGGKPCEGQAEEEASCIGMETDC